MPDEELSNYAKGLHLEISGRRARKRGKGKALVLLGKRCGESEGNRGSSSILLLVVLANKCLVGVNQER
jgi:hypothetical protein